MNCEIIEFPKLTKCLDCGGSGLTWNFQRRTKRAQAASPCKACGGSGRKRSTEDLVLRKEGE